MILQKYYAAICLSLLIFISAQAQEVWTLEKCVKHAQQNSLDVKQAEVGIQQAELTLKGNQMARLPNLNAGASATFNFGRTIDPVTNSFASERRFSNSLSLDSDMPVYTGGRISNTIEQGKYDLATARANAKDISNVLSLNVAQSYLSILLSEERLANAVKRKKQTQDQLNQTTKLVEAGTRPRNDLLNIEAQLALNEQDIISQENFIEIGLLNLKQLLTLPPDTEMVLDRPDIPIPADADPDVFALSNVYEMALQSQPQIVMLENQMKSAEKQIDIAKSGLLPRLTLFGNLFTRYSDKAIDFTNPTADYRYFDQTSDNFGQTIGLQLSVPIFNRYQTQINIENARLGVLNREVQNRQAKQLLKTNIQQAIADARAAKRSLGAAQKSVTANTTAFQNAEKQFKLGTINTFDLTTAQNNLDQAETDLIVAKYDYIFKLKVVDFYMGKTVSID